MTKITKSFLLTILIGLASHLVNARDEFGAASVVGAGSTLAHPLVQAWILGYQKGSLANVTKNYDLLDSGQTSQQLEYEAVGSAAGIQLVKNGRANFALSEIPLSSQTLSRYKLKQQPLAQGAIAIITNIDGLNQPIKLNGPLVAKIFSGQVSRWDDPQLKQLNPNLSFPSAPINVVFRSDGSGTTYAFSRYLSQVSPSWRQKMGVADKFQWPTGQGFKGTKALINAVKQQNNSIGYANYVDANKQGVAMAQLQNQKDQFTSPSLNSIKAYSAQTAQAYPIVATIYGLSPISRSRTRATDQFFKWVTQYGDIDTQRLGYAVINN